MGVLNARVGEGTSIAKDGGKFLGKIIEWRLITEKHDIENLLEVRIGLEGVAASNAAAHATPADIENLGELLRQMKDNVSDRKQFAAFDLEFHISLAKASGNAFLIDLVSMIRGQLARGLTKVLLLPNAIPLSLKEHVAMYDAIKRGELARDTDASALTELLIAVLLGVGFYAGFVANRREIDTVTRQLHRLLAGSLTQRPE